MPLPSPLLDSRNTEQLVQELLQRIAVYAPEWTDRTPSDPGITLLELFAFLGEQIMQRFNFIPEATRLAFLHLLGIPLRPAQPARALLILSTKSGPVMIKAGEEARAGAVPFEIEQPVVVLPIEAVAMAKLPVLLPPEDERLSRLRRTLSSIALASGALDSDIDAGADPEAQRERLTSWQRQLQLSFYEARALPRSPAVAGNEALDCSQAVDSALWLALLQLGKAPEPGMARPLVLSLGIIPAEEGDLGPTDVSHQPALLWEASTGGPVRWNAQHSALSPRPPLYQRLRLLADTTAGMQRAGVVLLQLPERWPELLGRFEVEAEDLRGLGELPPELEDEKQERRLLFWVRVRRQDGGPVGKIRFVGVNATTAVQCRTASPELMGVGTGQPDQRYALVHRPVLPGSLRLDVEEEGSFSTWEQVEGLEGSGADDRHYVLNVEAGEVRFGNGLRGRPPQPGQRIRATRYRHGGGEEGNVGPLAISKVVRHGSVTAGNPLRATGGAQGETVAEAMERIPAVLRHRERAVTAEDFCSLARETPGARIARAECLPLFHPSYPDRSCAGVLSLIVWPDGDPGDPQAPRPDRVLLRAVGRWLDTKRLASTELHILAPRYRRIALHLGVHTREGFEPASVHTWIEQALRQYLMPLPPYGPTGQGWPLGRRVHGPELAGVAMQVEGVEYIEGAILLHYHEELRGWIEGPVALRRDEVPQLAEITVVEGAPTAAATANGAALASLAALKQQQDDELAALVAHCAAERAQLLARHAEARQAQLETLPAAPHEPRPALLSVPVPRLREEC